MTKRRHVILDTDFMNYLMRAENSGEYYFEKIVEDLSIYPVIHEFLYEKEMMANKAVKKLVDDKQIEVLHYSDFLRDNDAYYASLFKDMYKFCNGTEISCKNFDFKTYQESGANLGEIHSIILALFTGYPLFFSNDNGARSLITKVNNKAYTLEVKNIMDVMEDISQLDNKTMTREDFVTLTKGDRGRKDRIKHIKDNWRS